MTRQHPTAVLEMKSLTDVFHDFDHRSRTAILENTSPWLPLGTFLNIKSLGELGAFPYPSMQP